MIIPHYFEQLYWYNKKAIVYQTARNERQSDAIYSSSMSLLEIFNANVQKGNTSSNCVNLRNEFLLKDAGKCLKYRRVLDSIDSKSKKAEYSDAESTEVVEKTFILSNW